MTKTERDVILDGECNEKIGKRGVLLQVKYKEKAIQLTRENGLIWLDIESAAGLSLVPENYKNIKDPTVTRWIKKNLKGKPIKIRTHIEFELTPELKNKFDHISDLLNKIEPSLIIFFKKFVEAFPDDVGDDKELTKLIRVTLRLILSHPRMYQPKTDEILEVIKEFIEEMDNFTTDLMSHFGVHRKIIIPRLGTNPDNALHKVDQSRRINLCPPGTICQINTLGLINTSTKEILKKAGVNITP